MTSYQYTPLSAGGGETRFLTLEPGCFSDDIHIQLQHGTLSESSPFNYEAISYAWGPTENPALIHIRIQGEETKTLLVTQNLFGALKHLRDETLPRTIWVDAICIDQNNISERSQQVAVMGSIFRLARRVVAWLGPEENNSTRAIKFLEELSSYTTVDWVTLDIKIAETYRLRRLRSDGLISVDLSSREAQAVYHLTMRPWFERLWICQEITLGESNAVLLCGKNLISWQSFRVGLYCVHICGLKQPDHLRTLFRDRCVMIRRLAEVGTYGKLRDLRTQLGQLKCSDPRDRIYGALNIIGNDTKTLGLYPDYSKTVTEVYQHTATQWIEKRRELGILASSQMPSSLKDIPSWVPDWSIPLRCRRLWRPSERDLWVDLVPFSFPKDGVLRISGVTCAIIDTVHDLSDIGPAMSLGGFCDKLRELLLCSARLFQGNTYITGEAGREAFCRTLIDNQFRDRFVPPREDLSHYNNCTQILDDMDAGRIHKEVKRYKREISYRSYGKCFFTTKEGYIGMAPNSAKPEDIICSIIGCETPMLIRSIADEANNTSYQLVGECYVHGLMAHEAIFGNIPSGYLEMCCRDTATARYVVRYHNLKSDTLDKADPRARRHIINASAKKALRSFSDLQSREEYIVNLWRDSGLDVRHFDLV